MAKWFQKNLKAKVLNFGCGLEYSTLHKETGMHVVRGAGLVCYKSLETAVNPNNTTTVSTNFTHQQVRLPEKEPDPIAEAPFNPMYNFFFTVKTDTGEFDSACISEDMHDLCFNIQRVKQNPLEKDKVNASQVNDLIQERLEHHISGYWHKVSGMQTPDANKEDAKFKVTDILVPPQGEGEATLQPGVKETEFKVLDSEDSFPILQVSAQERKALVLKDHLNFERFFRGSVRGEALVDFFTEAIARGNREEAANILKKMDDITEITLMSYMVNLDISISKVDGRPIRVDEYHRVQFTFCLEGAPHFYVYLKREKNFFCWEDAGDLYPNFSDAVLEKYRKVLLEQVQDDLQKTSVLYPQIPIDREKLLRVAFDRYGAWGLMHESELKLTISDYFNYAKINKQVTNEEVQQMMGLYNGNGSKYIDYIDFRRAVQCLAEVEKYENFKPYAKYLINVIGKIKPEIAEVKLAGAEVWRPVTLFFDHTRELLKIEFEDQKQRINIDIFDVQIVVTQFDLAAVDDVGAEEAVREHILKVEAFREDSYGSSFEIRFKNIRSARSWFNMFAWTMDSKKLEPPRDYQMNIAHSLVSFLQTYAGTYF